MDWKEYEKAVCERLVAQFRGARVRHDVRLPGRLSGTERQIDVLIEQDVGGLPIVLVVDCKYYTKKLDVVDVGQFVDLLEDVGATRGVMVTNAGFSEAAYHRARTHTRIQLHVVDFENLSMLQGFLAAPYRGCYGALISAPSGWVADALVEFDLRPNILCWLYPQELVLKTALERRQVMYVNIAPLDSSGEADDDEASRAALDRLIAEQNETAARDYGGMVRDSWEETYSRGTVRFRSLAYRDRNHLEYTGFARPRNWVAYVVVLTTPVTESSDLACLRFVLRELHLLELQGVDPTNSHVAWARILPFEKAGGMYTGGGTAELVEMLTSSEFHTPHDGTLPDDEHE